MEYKWTLDKFKENYEFFFLKLEKTEENLFTFFQIHKEYLPLFPENQYCIVEDNMEYIPINPEYSTIDVKDIYGSTWLFENEFSNWTKHCQRLAKMFLANDQNDFPAIFVTRYGDKYIASDGNHRIYHAYLRGWNQVKVCIDDELKC